jgi:hypothetical protein
MFSCWAADPGRGAGKRKKAAARMRTETRNRLPGRSFAGMVIPPWQCGIELMVFPPEDDVNSFQMAAGGI